MSDRSATRVAVVGAGPYGVSIAAHLRSAGIDFRIFGIPMSRWRCQMPRGMFLKSEGFASNLSDPQRRYSLARYCAEMEIPYGGTKPVPLEVFTQYALAFQRELVPNVEEVMVNRIEKACDWFELQLADGATVQTRRVVVATGMEHAAHVPAELAHLPPELLTHSSAHRDLSCFKGKDVTVIGGGQSALETAALLSEQGACVRLLARAPSLAWNSHPKPGRRSLYQRLRYPVNALGSGLQGWVYSNVPLMFHYLPQSIRFERVKNVLGPAGAWWLKDRVIDRVPTLLDHVVSKAEVRGGRAVLHVCCRDGQIFHLNTDHVIAATGYRFELQRLPFLSPSLKSLLRTAGQAPIISPHFESSVPGLYFTGLASANDFGPVMRFLHGAGHTARRVSGHIGGVRSENKAEPAVSFARPAESKNSEHHAS